MHIGLVRDGRAVLGVVGVPALGEMFGGIVGAAPGSGPPPASGPIHARVPPESGLAVVASRYHANDSRLDGFLAGRKIASVSNIGSGLKFCRVAEGAADLYPRFGRTMEWDTAGPQAVLEAAGGTVLDFGGGASPMASPAGRTRPSSAPGLPGARIARSLTRPRQPTPTPSNLQLYECNFRASRELARRSRTASGPSDFGATMGNMVQTPRGPRARQGERSAAGHNRTRGDDALGAAKGLLAATGSGRRDLGGDRPARLVVRRLARRLAAWLPVYGRDGAPDGWPIRSG